MKPTMEQNAMMMEEDRRRRREEVQNRFPTASVPYHLNIVEINNLAGQLLQEEQERKGREVQDMVDRILGGKDRT